MKNGAYINKHGMKRSKKLDQIMKVSWEWANDGGNWARKRDSIKMIKLRMRFEKEAERIGGVKYTFGDILA